MRLTIKQLVHAAHQAARYLPKASAQLMRDLAERLDTTQAALCESLKIRDALAAENAALKHAISVTMEHVSVMDTGQAGVAAMIINDALHNSEAPATDAWVNEQRAVGRVEGVNFAAARLAAAFNNGFIDKPTAEVYDVVKAVLGGKEELATAPEDGLSGEYAEQALNDWAAQLRGSQV
ncbi:hypothetical protein EGT71_01615 [Atlantibacter subterranea]|uniref:Ead/Ea22-like family protein n=1 Tax=Atlantibacter subterraneus TaxID=255519 RepID=A0A3R9F9M8_9ENTR|nr:hypothetical protein [Atlantibacter subterranea]RSB64441.1 hypothetical protein EGK67_04415 [Atlantibacter subterranea]RSE07769.1 hypothetical protein EGT84_04370 [Atlantibacter subterranea]RSE29245.1 hypothetical protein EGT71_01615 [Atlantibacter subterranea]